MRVILGLQSLPRSQDLLVPVESELERQRAARALWAGVHGIASLSSADKLSVVTTETAERLVDDLVATYLAGLAARRRAGEESAAPQPPAEPP